MTSWDSMDILAQMVGGKLLRGRGGGGAILFYPVPFQGGAGSLSSGI